VRDVAARSHARPRGSAPVVPALALALALLASQATPASADRAASATTHDSSVTTIILVRHAERDTTGAPDHPLTAPGLLRAQELVHTLGGSGISTIYVTRWQRTRHTALPLATAIGESLTVVNDVPETVRRLRTSHVDRTVLVVGHSNTIPDIVAGLTGRPFPTPDHVAYDGMWVVTLSRDGRASLLTLRYGDPVDGASTPVSPARH